MLILIHPCKCHMVILFVFFSLCVPPRSIKIFCACGGSKRVCKSFRNDILKNQRNPNKSTAYFMLPEEIKVRNHDDPKVKPCIKAKL